jgi:hypothetical protein
MQLFLVEPIKANVGLNSKPERAVAGIKEGENIVLGESNKRRICKQRETLSGQCVFSIACCTPCSLENVNLT